MDQPTAEAALQLLAPLVGEWGVEGTSRDGVPFPGEGRMSCSWLDSGAHLMVRTSINVPGAPAGISVIGCDAASGTYSELYSDDRGVCRIYGMRITPEVWERWREGEPFAQRFIGRFQDRGSTIVARWEKATDRTTFELDFALTYTKLS